MQLALLRGGVVVFGIVALLMAVEAHHVLRR
jgi:hypothetical protein